MGTDRAPKLERHAEVYDIAEPEQWAMLVQ
jgi:hypothetical protein